MRYVLIGIAMVAFLVVALAGFRGDISRKPPLEVFADMDRQPRLRPMEPNSFFKNGISSQPWVKGTVPRSEPLIIANGDKVYPFQTDHVVNKGYELKNDATNYVSIPLKVDLELLERGRERFGISCVPCHGAQGNGNGILNKRNLMGGIKDLHSRESLQLSDGQIFKIISEGQNTMKGYASNISVSDRWAIVAYVRALQLSRLGTEDEFNRLQETSVEGTE